MHVHILGICGTLMSGVAMIARQKGFRVTGADQSAYPPMSTQLEEAGIKVTSGYKPEDWSEPPDCVVIGNALSRGNPAVEQVLDSNIKYYSGAEFLFDHILSDRWVIAVSGTHGKTTASSMIAWILESAGMSPGFLIGGVPLNFGISARLGEAPFFVIEADEYDTAFFDKRSKFIHYHPKTLVINNIEFDHADIFPDLEAIKKQFHYLVRTIPQCGQIIIPAHDGNVTDVINMGCWTPLEKFDCRTSIDAGNDSESDFEINSGTNPGQYWSANNISGDQKRFDVCYRDEFKGTVEWAMYGIYNINNALAAIAAARHAGVIPGVATESLASFRGVKRRMEVRGVVNNITVYDDFAHHPTEISETIKGLRHRVGDRGKIIAILEPRSNTMKMGVHMNTMADSLKLADYKIIYQPSEIDWDLSQVSDALGKTAMVFDDLDTVIEQAVKISENGDHLLVMSNGAFGNIHDKLINALEKEKQI